MGVICSRRRDFQCTVISSDTARGDLHNLCNEGGVSHFLFGPLKWQSFLGTPERILPLTNIPSLLTLRISDKGSVVRQIKGRSHLLTCSPKFTRYIPRSGHPIDYPCFCLAARLRMKLGTYTLLQLTRVSLGPRFINKASIGR